MNYEIILEETLINLLRYNRMILGLTFILSLRKILHKYFFR